MLKTGVGSVATFTSSDGKIHVPGDVVDLPATYKGEAWLSPVDVLVKAVESAQPQILKTPETPKPETEKTGPGPEHIVAKTAKPHK